MHKFQTLIVFLGLILIASCDYKGSKPKINKDIRDFSDADMERLLDQWNDGEEDEFDDLENPMNIKQPEININELQDKSPEDLLKLTKKGKTLMTFVKVSGNPTKEEAEELTKLWQTALWNNHLQAERYMVDDDRAIFMFKDGAQALDAKEYLVQQERCESVTIENKVFKGKHHEAETESDSKDEL
ncbi:MESDC2 family protein [Megaselia abdita]